MIRINENTFQNVVCKLSAILFRPRFPSLKALLPCARRQKCNEISTDDGMNGS